MEYDFFQIRKPQDCLLHKKYACYFAALLEIGKLRERGEPALVAIDGRCGSGKTYFAALIEQLFPCNVLHMDDFYLPMEQRQENWREIPGGNMDFERFQTEVLLPIRSGKPALYRAYNCQTGQMGAGRPLPPQPLTVVEGSYSQHPCLAGQYGLKIFLTCSKEEQVSRLQEREGSHFTAFEERWIPMEERYFRCCAVEAGSDLVVDTSETLGEFLGGSPIPNSSGS